MQKSADALNSQVCTTIQRLLCWFIVNRLSLTADRRFFRATLLDNGYAEITQDDAADSQARQESEERSSD